MQVFWSEKGQRSAQIVFQNIACPTLREVFAFEDRTQRDIGAFGSFDKPKKKAVGAFWLKMSDKIFVNKYVPVYVPQDLKRYERDGLLTYIKQIKYERFSEDPDDYLKKLRKFRHNI